MEIADDLSKTLTGGFGGLYGEVVTSDCYQLKTTTWQPDIIFDLGANSGTCSRFCRELFPSALIVAVEPDSDNYATFKKFTNDNNLVLINKAIGTGEVYRAKGAANGAMEVYLSKMVGYGEELQGDAFTKSDIGFTTVEELFKEFYQPEMKSIVKIDIEGSENSIFQSEASMSALKQADYIVIEIHRYAATGATQQIVNDLTETALKSFEATHNCNYKHPIFFATKK